MDLNDKDYEIRIITLGDPGVGKTSIFKRFVYDEFDEDTLSLIGLGFTNKELILKSNEKIKLNYLIQGDKKGINIYQKIIIEMLMEFCLFLPMIMNSLLVI